MLPYNIVTAICLSVMGIYLISIISKIASTYKGNRREERIQYIRDYKRGRTVLIYIFVFPLLLAGLIYDGKPFFNALTGAMATVIDIVVLKFDPSAFSALMGDNQFFKASIYISYILIVLNAGMFAWSIAGQHISNLVTRLQVKIAKDKIVIFGNNVGNHTIYNSKQSRKRIIVDKITGENATALYMKNIVFCNVNSNEEYIDTLVKKCLDRQENIDVIINTENDELNIEIARFFVKATKDFCDVEKDQLFDLMRVFVFGDPRYEAIYEGVAKEGFGCISYVNKYQKMAVDFIDKYPYTRFMSPKHIDYASSCVKQGVDINAIMIGFGNTNRQIFLTSVANNQFIESNGDGVVLKKVKYHIFDKSFKDKKGDCECDANDKNLNHNYFRFKNETAGVDESKYLDFPDYPAEENFRHLDINDQDFYNEIRKVLTRSSDDANFIIIAFGSDLENIDMAEKLVSKIKEWAVDNATIFVKIRSVNNLSLAKGKAYIPICTEDNVVYDVDNILGDKIFKMSMMRDVVYSLEYAVSSNDGNITPGDIERVKAETHRSWFASKSPHERESNIYCTLSLRSKLNMMGLDYCSVDEEGEALDEETYLKLYAGEDMPDTTSIPFTADGKPIITYTLDFKKSRRGDMAIHEHYRWNSFMITKGFVPATKTQILEDFDEKKKRYTNGKNYDLRRHGNLTTFDGLVEFRQMVAKRDIKDGETMAEAEARKDVIKYDYQLLDDAYWLLSKTGHKIVKRNK